VVILSYHYTERNMHVEACVCVRDDNSTLPLLWPLLGPSDQTTQT